MSRNVSRRLRAVGTVLVAVGVAVGVATPANADPGLWDPTLPQILSAGAPGDPAAVANASLQATMQATQATMDLGASSCPAWASAAARRPRCRAAG